MFWRRFQIRGERQRLFRSIGGRRFRNEKSPPRKGHLIVIFPVTVLNTKSRSDHVRHLKKLCPARVQYYFKENTVCRSLNRDSGPRFVSTY